MRALFIAFLFVSQSLYCNEALDNLPKNDREKIECLFNYFGRLGNLGHVLFFENKPMCQTGIPLSCTSSVTPSFISDDPMAFQSEIKECWLVWKRYQDKFPHPNFIICEEITEVAGGEYLNVYFLNRTALKRCLEENSEVFREVFGEDFSPNLFVEALEGMDFSKVIRNDEMLRGILLGFGRTSACAFKNKESSLFPVSGKPKADRKFGIASVSFMTSDPECDEVKMLKEIYASELLKIASFFEDGSFAKRAIQALCE